MSFAHQMEAKMRENEDNVIREAKGGWEYEGFPWLLSRLKQETNELGVATKCARRLLCRTNLKNVIREAADVANFAMMIADNAKRDISEIQEK